MNQFVLNFDEAIAVQTEVLGVAILATVTGYGANKPALLSAVDQNEQFQFGTTAEAGGFMLQIKQSDLSAEPPKGTQVTCNGSATGATLQVVSAKLINAIWEITVGDIQAE